MKPKKTPTSFIHMSRCLVVVVEVVYDRCNGLKTLNIIIISRRKKKKKIKKKKTSPRTRDASASRVPLFPVLISVCCCPIVLLMTWPSGFLFTATLQCVGGGGVVVGVGIVTV